ncbi:CIZ1 protein, partial [Atractosteus spatula]|nr:CIZ1 protein [Atractosteus spatula]
THPVWVPWSLTPTGLFPRLLPGNLRGFAMGGQQFPPFFPAGARPSLLGPAPMGVAIKTPVMGFPPRHYHPHSRHYKDFARLPERKRECEQRPPPTGEVRSEGGSEGEPSDRAVSREDNAAVPDGQTQPSADQEEPLVKRQRTERSEEDMGTAAASAETLTADYKSTVEDTEPGECAVLEEGGSADGPEAVEFVEESRAAEVLGAGASLKVTIQQSSESRAFSTSTSELASRSSERNSGCEGPNRFYCYICSITCHNQQNFQSHMNGLAHQQRMMEIQHMSNACLVTLLPKVKESLQGSRREGEKRLGLQRWCATCQAHFTGDLIEHRRTREHKMAKHSSRPFCTVCKWHFRTPRKFVEHMKSPEHKQRVEEVGCVAGEILEELITVDAIGCFEGEEDYEEEPTEGEEEDEDSQPSHSQKARASSWKVAPTRMYLAEKGGVLRGARALIWPGVSLQAVRPAQREVALEEMRDDEEYDSETQYGSSFVVPVAGFLCRLCHKFYHFESTARLSHCKSQMHFQNLQATPRGPKSASDIQDPEKTSSDLPNRSKTDSSEAAVNSSSNGSVQNPTRSASPPCVLLEGSEDGTSDSMSSHMDCATDEQPQPADNPGNGSSLSEKDGCPDRPQAEEPGEEEPEKDGLQVLSVQAEKGSPNAEGKEEEAAREGEEDEDEEAGAGDRSMAGRTRATAPRRRSTRTTRRR